MSASPAESTDRFRLYSTSELKALPEPAWLIEGIFPLEAVVALYGASGDGKSFLALDWALSIASGTDWCGRSVIPGQVVYIAAEGGRSIQKRVRAWVDAHHLDDVPEAFFLLDAVEIADDEDFTQFLTCLMERGIQQPALTVVDTLARCFGAGDENSAQDMGKFVNGLERLKRLTQGTVMVVHHTGKNAHNQERGSSALRAAVNVMIAVSKKQDGLITVQNKKQKDDEDFKNIELRLQRVSVQGANADITSCVLVPRNAIPQAHYALPSQLRPTLQALASCSGGEATRKEWAAAVEGKDRTLDSHRKSLVADGCVESPGRGKYRITQKGRAALGTAATATKLQSAEPLSRPILPAATATTPEGVADAVGAADAAAMSSFIDRCFQKPPVAGADADEVCQ